MILSPMLTTARMSFFLLEAAMMALLATSCQMYPSLLAFSSSPSFSGWFHSSWRWTNLPIFSIITPGRLCARISSLPA